MFNKKIIVLIAFTLNIICFYIGWKLKDNDIQVLNKFNKIHVEQLESVIETDRLVIDSLTRINSDYERSLIIFEEICTSNQDELTYWRDKYMFNNK